MVNIYMWLGSVSFVFVIISMIIVALFDKRIYLFGFLFIVPSIIFFYKMAIIQPKIEYLEAEEICGVYEYEDYVVSSRPPYPKEYFIRFNHYGLFGFRNNAYPNRLNLENLRKGQKVCLILKRRKDKGEDLNQAILILLKAENKVNN
ncbi:hypothetical protein LVY74_17105 [Acinetobacter sp. ME22]|uniref:hypothetical protein n=1 Tax=Acinetobacter sp. ME22 TaxID=2904802 RepID=UPI001EDC2868|nr:hypothetical protein [Acinetobacter sp. ME22]MCG2575257.1 hypothetical protein [Acinetobacter sp. ME22]